VEAPLDRATLEAIAHEVADLRRRDAPGERALLTAGQVAARFGVDRSWVYAHAHELGVVRLGFGRRPRLRFDPAVVAQRLLTDRAARRDVAAPPSTTRVPLLPIRPTPRTLGDEPARRSA
jgi:hypothetical protein